MLQIRNLVKRFGDKEAVGGVSFAVGAGEAFGLLGPNGAGKSTIIAIMCGLLKPSSGDVLVGGIDLQSDPKAAKRLMGVVPQDIALYPALSARENLRFWGLLYGLGGKALESRVAEVLEIVDLADRQKDRIATFSGGMKRRINIAAALLHQPQILIMDEPTVGIDPQSRNHILETVKRLNTERAMTIVYTSHYMEEVAYLCQRLAIIDHGRVISMGSLEEIRRLIGNETLIRLRVEEPEESLIAAVSAIPGVSRVQGSESGIVAWVGEPAEELPQLLTVVKQHGKRLLGIEVEEPTLESVFLQLTGRGLRD
jgi:ABC-2 type transport system ATP-binding protein